MAWYGPWAMGSGWSVVGVGPYSILHLGHRLDSKCVTATNDPHVFRLAAVPVLR